MNRYVQFRGFVHIASVAGLFEPVQEYLERCFQQCLVDGELEIGPRFSMLLASTKMNIGANGSGFIFLGGEMIAKENEVEKWVNVINNNFDFAQGRVEVQLEGERFSKVLLLSEGKLNILEETTHMDGCGNGSDFSQYVVEWDY